MSHSLPAIMLLLALTESPSLSSALILLTLYLNHGINFGTASTIGSLTLFLSSQNCCQFSSLIKSGGENKISRYFIGIQKLNSVPQINGTHTHTHTHKHPKTTGLKIWLSHRCPFRCNYIKRGQVSVCSLSSACGLLGVTKIKDHPES